MAMQSFSVPIWAVTALFFLGFAPAGQAEPMSFPLGCIAGENCWIIDYPDLNDQAGVAQDYMCGGSAQDGDVFLRIALPDASSIPVGVPVLAAADGKIADIADGVPDRIIADRTQLQTGTSNCGNGVVIDHGGGMQTAYCHMREKSVRVVRGQSVRKGDILGFAGQSGLALWPQLGFSIHSGGYFVDPISGASTAEGCGLKPRPLIALQDEFMKYQPAAIVSLGFSTTPVSDIDLATGRAPRFAAIDKSEPAITLWGMVLGVHKGDQVEVRLRDPRGRSFYYTKDVANADSARMPINVTRRRGYTNWRTGLYTGDIIVTREVLNKPISVTRMVQVEVN